MVVFTQCQALRQYFLEREGTDEPDQADDTSAVVENTEQDRETQ